MSELSKALKPLAAILRPRTLSEVLGQNHLIGEGKPLRRMVERQEFTSSILWGPAGIGKTSLVRAMATETNSPFWQLNATEATVKEIRKIIDDGTLAKKDGRNTLVFVDEIHRWNKAQQDAMLPAVEDGNIVLFGATTEKPKFAVNSTLLSRSMVFELKTLSVSDLLKLMLKVQQYYKSLNRPMTFDKESATLLTIRASGDARKLITACETCMTVSTDGKITTDLIDSVFPDKHVVFDNRGNEHFDLAHAYQEAIQHSDADAAIYWLAKWISSGEDPAYICRRMMITAFEDCAGNPHAATMVMAAHYVTERTGLPECQIAMAQATIVMARSRRDKTGYNAIKAAMFDVDNKETVHVPEKLRAGTAGYVFAISKKYLPEDWALGGIERSSTGDTAK